MFSYRNKLFIDRMLGAPALFFLRHLTRLLGHIMRRDHTLPEKPKVVAVAKILGLGSIVYTGILCRALKERFPETKLLYVTSIGTSGLVRHMGAVDEVLIINDKNLPAMILSTAALILKFWWYRPVLYFDMEVYSSWAAIIATMSLALNRYGFYRRSSEIKKGMHNFTVFFNTKRHISEIYGRMVLTFGGRPDDDLSGILTVTDKDREECLLVLEDIGVNVSQTILVHTSASELLLERRWPPERCIDYLQRCVRDLPDYTFLLTGVSGDLEYVSSIYYSLSEEARKKVLNVAGKFSIGGFLALIEGSYLMVTNDSGPVHLAAALDKPTVSIWGPGDPEHYAPLRGFHKVIYKQIYCSPCLYHADFTPCKGDNVCVKNITADEVIKATDEILKVIKK